MMDVRQVKVSCTCMTWCRTPMMPCVALVKSGLVAASSESVAGQRWRTSSKALPLSLTCRQTGSQTDRQVRRLTGMSADREVFRQTDRCSDRHVYRQVWGQTGVQTDRYAGKHIGFQTDKC